MSGPFGSSHWVYNPSSGFYTHELEQSIKLNDDDNSHLKRTNASAGNRRTWTWSAWVKFGAMSHGTNQITLFDASSSGSEQHGIVFSGQQFYVFGYTTGFTYRKMLTALHRDPSAWYHYVVAFDTTDSTAGDRIKIYVNGTRQTDFDGTNTDPSLNYDTGFNNAVTHGLGGRVYDGANYFDGYIAEVNMIDGTALTAASFGETKDGIWVPKDTSGLTFGTNGFRLTFKDDVVSEGFNTVTYRGTGASQNISGLGFQPALVWGKRRGATGNHWLYDAVRGGTKGLHSDSTNTEFTDATVMNAFNPDGFTVVSHAISNASGGSYVAWCWEADTSFSNDASATSIGNVDSTGRTNTAKGFSIISWTYTTSSDNLVAHGLGAVPTFMLIKSRTTGYNWDVYHSGLSAATKRLLLNDNGAEIAGFFDTTPTSTVFEYNTSAASNNDEMIAYCWTDITGYSKFGSFTGNGGSQEITVGFRPALVALKRSSNASNWHVFDNTRNPANNRSNVSNWDRDAADATNGTMTFSATGFNDNGWISDAGQTVLYMAWADTREAAFFKDVSGQGNNFTPVNLDYRHSVPDVPTNNFATLNPIYHSSSQAVLSEGNLKADTAGFVNAADGYGAVSTFAIPKDKKIYIEVSCTDGTGDNWFAGFASQSGLESGPSSSNVGGSNAITVYNRSVYVNGSETDYGSSAGLGGLGVARLAAGDIFGVMCDGATGKVWFSRNGTYFKSPSTNDSGTTGDPAGGNHEIGTITNGTTEDVFFVLGGNTSVSSIFVNFGQDAANVVSTNTDGNGFGTFEYAPPTDYLALCSRNLTEPDIVDGSENFNTILYTADGNASRAITGVGFQPDWLWIKSRNATYYHGIWDSVRTNKSALYPNATNVEDTSTAGTLGSLDADGFTTLNVVGGGFINIGSTTYVAWNWKAGTAFSNDASATSVGTIDSTGSINTKAGFSIISYTGNNTSNATVAHGLSATPEMIIVRARNEAENWVVYHKDITPASNSLSLNLNIAATSFGSGWIDNATSTVFRLKDGTSGTDTRDNVNKSTTNYIAYCFHSVEGYSKVGSYNGNANADGTFVYTGFRPAWILTKNAADAEWWTLIDNKRLGYNETNSILSPNDTAAEYAAGAGGFDIVSNGFKIRGTSGNFNGSGDNHIYIAFADQPFKYSNAR